MKLFKNKYFLFYTAIYLISMILLNLFESYPIEEIVGITLIFGIVLPSIAFWVSKSSKPFGSVKESSTAQIIYLIVCLIIITVFLGFGTKVVINLFELESTSFQLQNIIILFTKLLFFVFIPFIFFSRKFGFTIKDFGVEFKIKKWFEKKHISVLLILVPIMILFQWFVGQGAAPIRDGDFSYKQLIIFMPLTFCWLMIEVGLVEEFFFRSVLQSRVSAYLKSETGGILITAVLFGLAHAPGLYLRGAGIDSPVGTSPSLLLSLGYSIVVLSAVGLFLGVVWSRTRNLILVMMIHAAVDLLPNFDDFITIWNS